MHWLVFYGCWVWQHSYVEIDHEIFSMVIFSHQLIQEELLSVFGKRIHMLKCWLTAERTKPVQEKCG